MYFESNFMKQEPENFEYRAFDYRVTTVVFFDKIKCLTQSEFREISKVSVYGHKACTTAVHYDNQLSHLVLFGWDHSIQKRKTAQLQRHSIRSQIEVGCPWKLANKSFLEILTKNW